MQIAKDYPSVTTVPPGITTLDLSVLLERLRENTAEVLQLIDGDELLTKRRGGPDGRLVIANASKRLGLPYLEHHLYAKGIVYDPETWELVSLPLVKMYNHGMNAVSDATSSTLIGRGTRVEVSEKLDGTMIQSFVFEGEVYLSTRGVLEGDPEHGAEFLPIARELLEETRVLECVKAHEGSTFTYELIHPAARVITDYGVAERIVLHGATCLRSGSALHPMGLRSIGRLLHVEAAWAYDYDDSQNYYSYATSMGDAASGALRRLVRGTDVPEGVVLSITDGSETLHRVKVKTAEYVRLHALRFNVSLRSVATLVYRDAALREWEAYRDHVTGQVEVDEETLSKHREYHDATRAWLERAEFTQGIVSGVVGTVRDELAAEMPGVDERHASYFKRAAELAREETDGDGALFGMVMTSLRKGLIPIEEVHRRDPIVPGFRKVIDERGQR